MGQVEFYTDESDTTLFEWVSDTPDTTFTYHSYESESFIRLRVRGIDGEDRMGPYGTWAEWFIYYGTPGSTSQPLVIQVGKPVKPE